MVNEFCNDKKLLETISNQEPGDVHLECTVAFNQKPATGHKLHFLQNKNNSKEWPAIPDRLLRLMETSASKLKDIEDPALSELGMAKEIAVIKAMEKGRQPASSIVGYMTQLATKFIDLDIDTVDSSLVDAIEKMGNSLAVDQICVHVFNSKKSEFTRLLHWNSQKYLYAATNASVQKASCFPWLMKHMLRAETVVVDRIEDLPAEASTTFLFMQSQGVVSALIIPLVWRGFVDGFLCVESLSTVHEWSEEEIATLKLMASIVAGALRHKKADTALMKTEERLRNLNENLESQVKDRTARLEESLEAIKKSQEIIIQYEKLSSIGQLAAGVAHEINNPTGYIMSNLTIFKDYFDHLIRIIAEYDSIHEAPQVTEGLVKEALSRIHALKKDIDFDFVRHDGPELLNESLQGTERIKGIVLALQSYARNPAKDKTPVLVEELLDRAIKLTWNELKYKCDVAKDYGKVPYTMGLENQLLQVFINILLNAAQAIPKKGSITISTSRSESSITVAIRDTGTGILPENIRKVMDPFFTTKPVGQGTGLGLYISQGIITEHEGTINIQSEVGVGTTFTITLPLLEYADAVD